MGDGWRGRILLVDADLVAAQGMCEVLVDAGYKVTVTNNGAKVCRGVVAVFVVFSCLGG